MQVDVVVVDEALELDRLDLHLPLLELRLVLRGEHLEATLGARLTARDHQERQHGEHHRAVDVHARGGRDLHAEGGP